MANTGMGAEFEPAILQILSPLFDCTMLNSVPSKVVGTAFEPAILQSSAEGFDCNEGPKSVSFKPKWWGAAF